VISMHKIILFGEDYGHETVLKALISRLADNYNLRINITTRSAQGGAGRVLSEVEEFLKDVDVGIECLPDLLVVAIDANCIGMNKKIAEIEQKIPASLDQMVICAVPDPHIERWVLLDSHAFKNVLGVGCEAPKFKCERGRYKLLLSNAVRQAGIKPLLGGLEFAEDIIKEMDLKTAQRKDKSIKRTISEIERFLKRWIADKGAG